MCMKDIIFDELPSDQYMMFYKSLRDARLMNNHGYYVDLDDPDHYKNTKNFLIEGNIGGFAIDDGNLIAVHKNPVLAKDSNIGHIMHSLMLSALSNGADKLDCYGDFLGETYMQYGFLPVGKMTFNRQYNPNWPYHEEPNVYVMFRAVKSLEELVALQTSDSLEHLDEIEETLPVFDDYDKLMGERDKILKKLGNSNLSYERIVNMIKTEDLIDE